jgi:deoxyribodipyrimidine photo-lyase
MTASVVWLKDDLRMLDNQALSTLIKDQNPKKIALFILEKDAYLKRQAQAWWLAKSLENFQIKLEKNNIILDVVLGNAEKTIENLIKNKKINKIYWNKSCDINENKIEIKIKKIIQDNNIYFNEFEANLLNPVEKIKKNDDTPFKVFTHFWKKSEEHYLKKQKEFRQKDISSTLSKKGPLHLKNIKNIEEIYPKKEWYRKFNQYWEPSEEKAVKILDNFIREKIEKYATNRDLPWTEGTSKLSPYLRFGQISVNYIMQKCLEIKSKKIGYRKYINELGWREFCHSLLHNFPEMQNNNLRKDFDNFKWNVNKEFLRKWKNGNTGYPIVDAGMRELYETGWMHNRVRMITASFLVKHLRIHWMEGEKYFRNTLLDYNLANNVSGWQWVAGTGADAAPYFRIFNPILQGEKFDTNGEYVKKWCPELKNVPNEFIHKPWEMPIELQKKIMTLIGDKYPQPIVNHKTVRDEALKAFQQIKK